MRQQLSRQAILYYAKTRKGLLRCGKRQSRSINRQGNDREPETFNTMNGIYEHIRIARLHNVAIGVILIRPEHIFRIS